MMWSLLFIILLVRFGLLSGHLCGNCCRLGWPYDLIVFCQFLIFIYFPFLRAGQVWCRSRQTIVFGVYSLHFLQNLKLISKYCVRNILQYFMLKCLLCLPPVRVGRHIVFPLASVCLCVCGSVCLSVTKSCPLYNLITVTDISTKLHTFVKHIETMCHAQEP